MPQWPQGAPDGVEPLQTGVKVGVYAPAETGATKNVKVDIDDIKAYAETGLQSQINTNASNISDNTAAIGVNTGLINDNVVDISSIQSILASQLHPVGETYIQYPGKLSPTDLGYPGTWVNISSEFAGDFFRAEGGDASAFESGEQAFSTDLKAHNHNTSIPRIIAGSGTWGVQQGSNSGIDETFASSSFQPSTAGDDETRPVNMTVRIWERTA